MDRSLALSDLLCLRTPLDTAIQRIGNFAWDSDVELVTLEPKHIVDVLVRFLARELSAAEVESWANAIEGREDIGLSQGLPREALHELANPALTFALTESRARWWLLRLRVAET